MAQHHMHPCCKQHNYHPSPTNASDATGCAVSLRCISGTRHCGGARGHSVARVTRHSAGWIRDRAEFDAIGAAVCLSADYMWPKSVWRADTLYKKQTKM